MPGGKFRELCTGGLYVTFRAVNLGQTEDRILVLRLTLQDGAVRRFRRVQIATLLRPVRQGEVDAGGGWLLAQKIFRLLLFAAVAQAVGGLQHLVTLQTVGKFLNITVPLAARQGIQMRQRGPILVVRR